MHRCKKHQSVRTHNLNADGGSEECGACIMGEVYVLFHVQLDLLDGYADLMTHHAKLRTALAEARKRLAFYEPQQMQES